MSYQKQKEETEDLDQLEKIKILNIVNEFKDFCEHMGDVDNARNKWLSKIKILKKYIENK